MASGKEIKSRIHSIKNTQKTTKAMELVAGAKMRKSVQAALQTRAYHRIAWSIASRLRFTHTVSANEELMHFFQESGEEVSHTTIVVMTSNRGLCGAFNANVVKKVLQYVEAHTETVSIIGMGKKGVATLSSFGMHVEQAYEKNDSANSDQSVRELSAYLYKQFSERKTHRVLIAYTDYQSAMLQEARLEQLYPLPPESRIHQFIENEDPTPRDGFFSQEEKPYYLYEPTSLRILSYLIPRIAEVELYQALLESNASEHSARMIAMKNATEAAAEMGEELKLLYNRARQASITKEIAEISAGTAAVS